MSALFGRSMHISFDCLHDCPVVKSVLGWVLQGCSQDFTLGAQAERQRRENRGAEGADGWTMGRGCPPPQPTSGSEKHRELLLLDPAAANAFLAYLRPTENFGRENSVTTSQQLKPVFTLKIHSIDDWGRGGMAPCLLPLAMPLWVFTDSCSRSYMDDMI